MKEVVYVVNYIGEHIVLVMWYARDINKPHDPWRRQRRSKLLKKELPAYLRDMFKHVPHAYEINRS